MRSQSLNHHYKCIEGGRTYQESNIKYVVKAAPAIPSFGSESHASSPKNIFDSVKNFLVILYYFCYPYSMIARVSSNFSSVILINNPQILWLILTKSVHLDDSNIINVLNVNLICLWPDIVHNFRIFPCGRETIRYISIILCWFVTGQTQNMFFLL